VQVRQKISIIAVISVLLFGSMVFYSSASAESLPQWIKNTALWYGEGLISETEFLNAIKFLLENDLIVIDEETDDIVSADLTSSVLIPNGNYDVSGTSFYIPLNLEVTRGTNVIWVNDDSVPHTVQSQNDKGEIIGLFNSAPLQTGESFEYTFDESGVYNYYCSFHPWRVGIVTVR
jgi:plastocyanin